MMDYSRVILFTSCVDPNGMTKTAIHDKQQREQEYKRALQFYLEQTVFPIVVVDNSGFIYQELHEANPERIETLSFQGNDFDRNLGKGYGEGLILRYALEHSTFIQKEGCRFIYKISGRHILLNLNKLASFMHLAESYSDKVAFAVLKEKERWAVSDFFSGPISFYQALIPYLEGCNDSKKKYFEHRLFRCIEDTRKAGQILFIHIPFPLIQEGISGSTGKPLQKEGSFFKYSLKALLYVCHLSSLMTFYNKRIR